jgi:hypothetical protein
MDAELATLTSTAATTMVNLLATDGREGAKTAVGVLRRRVHADKAATVETDIVEARGDVLAVRQAGDVQAEQALVGEWQARLWQLMAVEPGLAEELRQLVEELSALLPDAVQAPAPRIEMNANVSGHGQAYQAARDLHITDS